MQTKKTNLTCSSKVCPAMIGKTGDDFIHQATTMLCWFFSVMGKQRSTCSRTVHCKVIYRYIDTYYIILHHIALSYLILHHITSYYIISHVYVYIYMYIVLNICYSSHKKGTRSRTLLLDHRHLKSVQLIFRVANINHKEWQTDCHYHHHHPIVTITMVISHSYVSLPGGYLP